MHFWSVLTASWICQIANGLFFFCLFFSTECLFRSVSEHMTATITVASNFCHTAYQTMLNSNQIRKRFLCFILKLHAQFVNFWLWFVFDFISIRSHFGIDFEETRIAWVGNNCCKYMTLAFNFKCLQHHLEQNACFVHSGIFWLCR